MASEWLLESIEEEFEGADFGDDRLTKRLMLIAPTLDRAPQASLSLSSKSVAAREAAYRFVENPAVSLARLLEPHLMATAQRCREAKQIYVVSDTTEFTFAGEARGEQLGRIKGKQRGFLGHFALAVSASGDRKPLGVLGISTLVRQEEQKAHRNVYQQKKDPTRESLRWGRMVDDTEELLDGVSAIHVMDREADIFELLSSLDRHSRRFVIRAAQDRMVVDEGNLFDVVENLPTLLEREVQLSARPKPRVPSTARGGRGHPARPARLAQLSVCSRRVTISRPKTSDSSLPATLSFNVVHVYEAEPPPGQSPIQWMLLTSEPVETEKDVAAVVDAYRARWLIEEYFKALKTGCAYESRQLRSMRTLTNVLGVLAVIAWRLLLIRTLERAAPLSPATDILDPVVLEALAARLKDIGERKPFPEAPTVVDVMNGIARLGGHHKSNGPPGWQLLWNGFQDLLMWTSGFIAGRSSTSCDHS